MKYIIGLSGKIGSGKNYIAEKILYNMLTKRGKNVSIIAFGDYLKMMCYTYDNIPYEKLFINKDEDTRKILQTRGTDARKSDDNVFIKMLECNMKILFDRNTDVIIVTDVRFNNEVDFLKSKNSILIRINAINRTINKMRDECGTENTLSISTHKSETELDNYNGFDYIINNDYDNEKNVYNILNEILEESIHNAAGCISSGL